ncbi:two-component system, response regulator YesN [Evansella caseinilytica]|uniref:Two-component system, response regulator YesN n=1 Tax=Evansella caseinilytica TaxID=1503961 RepID=A0A1H3IHG0_9BACI|nr:response regulator [Evansella caseinilytica]SDY26815.1 two-component system, response regulator YesN [Evansella caseinilytica]
MKSLLIVDDDQNVIKGLRKHVPWSKFHLKVEATAGDGLEALEKIREKQPDILITDIYMPNMDGLELIQRVRKEFPAVSIIIHSGYDDFDNARQAMKYGVRHFLLKPCTVPEIEAVLEEMIREIVAQEKQQRLLKHYHEQMNEHLEHIRQSLFRELIHSKYKAGDLPVEKLAFLGIAEKSAIVVTTISLIRSPYLTKGKEREWQLNHFAAGNIIKETLEESGHSRQAAIHIVDYSESTFLLVFIAKNGGENLAAICKNTSEQIAANILLYPGLSLAVGIGKVKAGIHELSASYLESRRALEAAEYQEINKVYTYSDVQPEKEDGSFPYPFELVRAINDAINDREYESILIHWGNLENYLLSGNKIPIIVGQNICISIVSAIMVQKHREDQFTEEAEDMSTYISVICNNYSLMELVIWMRTLLRDWQVKKEEELTGSKSNQLIYEVKKHVHHYYDQEISLAVIADKLFINRNYLSQLFKKVTGETFVAYLNKYRIEKAKERLREKHYMIYEISELVGYQNPTYFSQVFKAITGISPSEYCKNVFHKVKAGADK